MNSGMPSDRKHQSVTAQPQHSHSHGHSHSHSHSHRGRTGQGIGSQAPISSRAINPIGTAAVCSMTHPYMTHPWMARVGRCRAVNRTRDGDNRRTKTELFFFFFGNQDELSTGSLSPRRPRSRWRLRRAARPRHRWSRAGRWPDDMTNGDGDGDGDGDGWRWRWRCRWRWGWGWGVGWGWGWR